MPVEVNLNGFTDAPSDLIRAAAEAVLIHESSDAEMSITLVSDEEMTVLNREYLEKDRTTDVIAFTLGRPGALLGDVYLCVDQARRQALDLSVSERDELARLAIHGTLHVLGYDHPEGADRQESPMFELQERILLDVLSAQA